MLKNLKSLFIVEEPSEEKKEAPKQEKKETLEKTIKQTTVSASQPTRTTSSVSNVDRKIIEKLLSAIENNNQEGFDYLEFKKALKALEKMPMDEATKYRSTFATASTLGVTLNGLVSSAGHYVRVLEKENSTFLKTFEGQLSTKVGDKEKEIVQFDNIIKEKAAAIKQLTDEITKHQAQIATLKQEVQESRAKIDQTQNNFKFSYLHLRTQLEEDVQKMKQYLK